MLKHIVMFKFKVMECSAERREAVEEIRKGLMALDGVVPSLRSIEVGVNSNPKEEYDLVLTTVFDDMEGLAAYAVHPEHQKVVALIGAIKESRACVDFEF